MSSPSQSDKVRARVALAAIQQFPSQHFRISTDCRRYGVAAIQYFWGGTRDDGFGIERMHARCRQANTLSQIMTDQYWSSLIAKLWLLSKP
jgi:hypothetical protein